MIIMKTILFIVNSLLLIADALYGLFTYTLGGAQGSSEFSSFLWSKK